MTQRRYTMHPTTPDTSHALPLDPRDRVHAVNTLKSAARSRGYVLRSAYRAGVLHYRLWSDPAKAPAPLMGRQSDSAPLPDWATEA